MAKLRHLIDAQQLTPNFMEVLFERAAWMQERVEAKDYEILEKLLLRRRLFSLFFEPSTRTRFSFESAASLLGMKIHSSENAAEFSSRTKGEDDGDMFRVVEGYAADAIVVRHDKTNDLPRIARMIDTPIINAGDGRGQHPTQALLDMFTIQQEFGRLRDLHIAMVGDLANGRTVRSLSYLLGKYPGNHITFVAPPGLEMGEDIKKYLKDNGVTYADAADLSRVLPEADIIYHTRIQVERIEAAPTELQQEYDRVAGQYRITPAEMKLMKPDAIVMHPLPRVTDGFVQKVKTPAGPVPVKLVGELAPECDSDRRAAYFRQAANGLPVRMAVLEWAVNPQ